MAGSAVKICSWIGKKISEKAIGRVLYGSTAYNININKIKQQVIVEDKEIWYIYNQERV